MDISKIIHNPEYSFLKDGEYFKDNIVLLGLGGSYAYGTNTPESDLDIRGCAVDSSRDILLGRSFEQMEDENTDTVIYSFNKMIKLLINCNPNCIEILGLKPEHYIHKSYLGQKIIDNKDLFLSQIAAKSFGGYADAQLYRLKQKTCRFMEEDEYNKHICNVISGVKDRLKDRYGISDIDVYVSNGIKLSINVKDFPMEDVSSVLSEFNNILRDYKKQSRRNDYVMTHNKIAKHSMHLVRLLVMGAELLSTGEIHTYRDLEHDVLMDIRNGKYIGSDGKPNEEFFGLVDDLNKKFEYAKKYSVLPEKPDNGRIEDFTAYVNEEVIRGRI